MLGGGVYASLSDSSQAAESVNVGTTACVVSSNDSHATVVGTSVTIAEPDIVSTLATHVYLTDLTVTTQGTIPTVVTWSDTHNSGAGSVTWKTPNPADTASLTTAGNFAYTVDGLSSQAALAGGASQTYTPNAIGIR